MLDLQPNIRYSSFWEQKTHLLKKLISILNADDEKFVGKIFSIAHQQRHFRRSFFSTNFFMHSTQRARKYIEKQSSFSITLHETQTLPQDAILLQTHWENMASVHRILPKYWIAFCKPKSYTKAVNYFYSNTENKKFV